MYHHHNGRGRWPKPKHLYVAVVLKLVKAWMLIAKYNCEREAKETAGGMGNTQLLFLTSAHRFIIKLFVSESQSQSSNLFGLTLNNLHSTISPPDMQSFYSKALNAQRKFFGC
jgi:hypothetical protein